MVPIIDPISPLGRPYTQDRLGRSDVGSTFVLPKEVLTVIIWIARLNDQFPRTILLNYEQLIRRTKLDAPGSNIGSAYAGFLTLQLRDR